MIRIIGLLVLGYSLTALADDYGNAMQIQYEKQLQMNNQQAITQQVKTQTNNQCLIDLENAKMSYSIATSEEDRTYYTWLINKLSAECSK